MYSSMLSGDKKLTMSLCLLAAAWTTLDQTASALLDGALSILGSLKFGQQKLSLKMNIGGLTVYWQKANALLCVASNLDEDWTEFTEDLSDGHLKGLLILRLKKAFDKLAYCLKLARGELTWQRRHSRREGRRIEHPRP